MNFGLVTFGQVNFGPVTFGPVNFGQVTDIHTKSDAYEPTVNAHRWAQKWIRK